MSSSTMTHQKRERKTLEQLNDEINTIVNATDGIDKIVRFLGILGITAKIECSRLNQDNVNFNSLAEDVGQLAISIRSQLDPIVEALEINKENNYPKTISYTSFMF